MSGEERGVSIRSFGIVNVTSLPLSNTLTLNGLLYGNDEKKMVDYGDYTLDITNENYLTNSIAFSINKEKPYYIDSITLVPRPQYSLYSGSLEQISKIDTNAWTARSESGILLFEKDFSTGILIASGSTYPIGEGRFLSGKTIVSYDLMTRRWIKE